MFESYFRDFEILKFCKLTRVYYSILKIFKYIYVDKSVILCFSFNFNVLEISARFSAV